MSPTQVITPAPFFKAGPHLARHPAQREPKLLKRRTGSPLPRGRAGVSARRSHQPPPPPPPPHSLKLSVPVSGQLGDADETDRYMRLREPCLTVLAQRLPVQRVTVGNQRPHFIDAQLVRRRESAGFVHSFERGDRILDNLRADLVAAEIENLFRASGNDQQLFRGH